MPRTGSRTAAGLAGLAALVLLSGCAADDVPASRATATASGTPAATEPASAPATAIATAPEDDGPLAALEPCGVVNPAGLASLGLTGGEAETLGEARVCRYRFEGPTLNETFTVSVELFDTYGLADIVATGSEIEPLAAIGGHEARRFTEATGGCVVSLGVTDTSRVDATAVGGDTALACDHAAGLAALVAPVLP